MRIENLRTESNKDRAKVAADVTWEDSDFPPLEMFFDTESRFAKDLSCNPHAFLVACIVPSMHHQEARVAIDAEVCPELLEGLKIAMMWIRSWYYPDHRLVAIEARTSSGLQRRAPRSAGMMLSGGIDSLAALRANRLSYPLSHPGSIKVGLLVHGFDIGGNYPSKKELESFDRATNTLSEVAADAGVELIPLFTNIKHLDNDYLLWREKFFAAACAAVAHAFADRLDSITIAGSHKIPDFPPWGSHPVLDLNYSSHDLRVRHVGIEFSRLQKAKLVAQWDAAFQNLRVCTKNVPGVLNCGRCEKCVRTMAELLAAGALDKTKAFPQVPVDKELLSTVRISSHAVEILWDELISPLHEIGRQDLVRVIEEKIREYHRRVAREEERDWRGRLKRLDRKYLGGTMIKVSRFIQGAGR